MRPLTDLARLLPLIAGLLILHARTGVDLIWGIAAAVLAVVTGLTHWATTRYLVTDERLYLRHGLFNQKRLSVARDRIRSVDVTAHLLHRMLGVCRVSIGTGRNDYRSGEGFRLDGLTRRDAESLRVLLLAGPGSAGGIASYADGPNTSVAGDAAAGPAARDGTGAPEESASGEVAGEIVRLRLGWLRFAPLTMTGLVVLGVLFGTAVQVTDGGNYNFAASGPVRRIVSDYAALSLSERVVAGIAVAIIGYVLIAMIGYVAVYWNFQLARDGRENLRVTRGLLSVRATTIALSRLRGAEISEPLLLRAARGARCTAITTGLLAGRGSEHEGSVLVPPAPATVAIDVAVGVLGVRDELFSGPLERHGSAARRRRFVRALAGAAVIVAAISVATVLRHGPVWIPLGSLLLLPLAWILAVDRYRSLGHRLEGGWLVTRMGSLARRRSVIETDAIIGWRIHQTWFQRRQGLMTLTATTAAGQQHYSVHDVPVSRGLAIAATASPGLVEPFLMAD